MEEYKIKSPLFNIIKLNQEVAENQILGYLSPLEARTKFHQIQLMENDFKDGKDIRIPSSIYSDEFPDQETMFNEADFEA